MHFKLSKNFIPNINIEVDLFNGGQLLMDEFHEMDKLNVFKHKICEIKE